MMRFREQFDRSLCLVPELCPADDSNWISAGITPRHASEGAGFDGSIHYRREVAKDGYWLAIRKDGVHSSNRGWDVYSAGFLVQPTSDTGFFGAVFIGGAKNIWNNSGIDTTGKFRAHVAALLGYRREFSKGFGLEVHPIEIGFLKPDVMPKAPGGTFTSATREGVLAAPSSWGRRAVCMGRRWGLWFF